MFDKSKIIPIGADHGGFKLKQFLMKELLEKGYKFQDYGCFSEESVDYPDVAHPLANDIADKKYELGILICGSGNGINMAANHHKGIRSALCWNKEIAQLARQHNNANIIALPGRFIDFNKAIEVVETFLNTEFEGGRHEKRIEKIDC